MTIGSIGFSSYGMYAGLGATGSAPASVTGVNTEEEAKDIGLSDSRIKGLKRSGQIECSTCASRKYQDGSDESDVSFKAAAHISPEASAARVRSHEQEHVSNAYSKAAKDNGRVLQASVTMQTAVCPECGRSYTAGGLTTTRIAYSEDGYGQNAKKADEASIVGSNFDLAV
ncbi:MAG: hypothetical protein K5840_06915 [Eubacterium sp.]|nr:hypothetical protein [Eubacterium sp.]